MIERTYLVSDVVKERFLRLPLSLLANPTYSAMSLEAKFVYSLLLNRLTLSQQNGWVNAENEVYLIYTREEIANLLNISYKKSIAAFKELIKNGLLYEQRQGRGFANLLYVLKPEITEYDAAKFYEEFYKIESENDQKDPENPCGEQICQNGTSRTVKMAYQELPNRHIKNCRNGTSRTAETAYQELPKSHTSNNNINKTDCSKSILHSDEETAENGSTTQPQMEGQTNFTEVLETLESDPMDFENLLIDCELDCLPEEMQPLMRTAIETMFYAEDLCISGRTVQRWQIRERLKLLNAEILLSIYRDYVDADTVEKPIKNRMNYLISCIYNNSVTELAAQGADISSVFGAIPDTVSMLNRGLLDYHFYLNSDVPAIREAAERRAKIQNSG